MKVLAIQLKVTVKVSEKVEYLAGKMYGSMAKKAHDAGYDELAKAFDGLAKSETGHGKLLSGFSGELK